MAQVAALSDAMAGALRERGVTDPAASLAAELGCLAFRNAYARWAGPANQRDTTGIAHEELDALRDATAALAHWSEGPLASRGRPPAR